MSLMKNVLVLIPKSLLDCLNNLSEYKEFVYDFDNNSRLGRLELIKIGNIIFGKAHFITNSNKNYGIVIPKEFRPKQAISITGQHIASDNYYSTGTIYIDNNGTLRHSYEESGYFIAIAIVIYKV